MPQPPFAQLQAVDLSHLLEHDAEEITKLTKACHEDGFFYLNLTDKRFEGILKDWKTLLPLVNNWFNEPIEDKMKYNHGTVRHGYTPIGSYAGVVEGTKDGNETIKVTGEAFENPLLLPPVISRHMELFTRFNNSCREVTIQLLKVMSDILKFENGSRIENSHRNGYASSSCLNLIRYERDDSQVYHGQNKHTDNGTLTLLLTEQWGLQILSKETQDWEFVEPKPGHAVINVADTLRFLSGMTFRSSVHRAVPIFEGEQRHRFAIGYFLRAEDDQILTAVGGETMTAKQWHDRKYVNYKATHDVQKMNPILLGGMDVVAV